eukprot:341086-Rhodomonas_salina.3
MFATGNQRAWSGTDVACTSAIVPRACCATFGTDLAGISTVGETLEPPRRSLASPAPLASTLHLFPPVLSCSSPALLRYSSLSLRISPPLFRPPLLSFPTTLSSFLACKSWTP